jgi:hypothetical protein
MAEQFWSSALGSKSIGPPDYELVLIQAEPVGWVNIANLTLFGTLRGRARPRQSIGAR